MERLLTRKAVAELLNRTPRTLARWGSLGYGPSFTYIGNECLYAESDVENFVEGRIQAGRRAHAERGGAECL